MRAVWLMVALAMVSACKKPPENLGPREGWVKDAGWKVQCYYPKAWDTLGAGERKITRQKALEEMEKQWRGEMEEDVNFGSDLVLDVDTILLGRPENIEAISGENATQCEAYNKGGSIDDWKSWLSSLKSRLTAGECNHPLVDTLFSYLSINASWQNKAYVCPGDKVLVQGTEIDYYRLTPKGPWMNAAGDKGVSTTGKESFPCNTEGCYQGMLIGRFTGDSGSQIIFPVGAQAMFKCPESGKIEVMINDDSLEDNRYKIESGLEHHMGITYKPAE
jgi:hypothetical protein